MLVGSLNGNLMYHFLVAALLLPCADFSKQRSPPGMHMDAELVWCWSGRVGGGFLQLCSPKPEAALCNL